MEDGPRLTIGEYEGRRDNSELYTFVGNLVSRNCIHLIAEVDGEEKSIFKFLSQEETEDAIVFMLTHDFEAHLNMKQRHEQIENAYDLYVDQTVGSELIPDTLEGFDE